jgi:hypothetical protein
MDPTGKKARTELSGVRLSTIVVAANHSPVIHR